MKLTVKRSVFLQKLQTVQRVISSKTTIPILTGVKIMLSEDGLSLTGSNTDTSIESFLSRDDEEAQMTIERIGNIALQSRFFGEIICKLPGDMFTMGILGNNRVMIISGKTDFTVNGLDADNYPHLPIVDTQDQMKLPIHLLIKIISETGLVVSMHGSRPILTGVHFTLKNQKLLAVAADSYRLSQCVIPTEQVVEDFNIIIPGKSLAELSRSLTNEEEMVETSIVENQVLFKTETTYFYSRLSEGNYPDTSRLIPTNHSTQIEFYVPELLSAVEHTSLLSHKGCNNIVCLSISPDSVVLYEDSPETEEIKEASNYENVSGEALNISFSPDYMKGALRAFDNMNITVKFLSPIHPFTLEPTETELNFTQLTTPVRTN